MDDQQHNESKEFPNRALLRLYHYGKLNGLGFELVILGWFVIQQKNKTMFSKIKALLKGIYFSWLDLTVLVFPSLAMSANVEER